MVYNTTPSTRGRAAGWFQSGNQFGQTAGGGIGLWLTINLFFALSTLFSLGVLRLSRWAHDHWGTNGMLFTEAGLGVLALLLFFGVARRIPGIARLELT